jgi:hypothetical protein
MRTSKRDLLAKPSKDHKVCGHISNELERHQGITAASGASWKYLRLCPPERFRIQYLAVLLLSTCLFVEKGSATVFRFVVTQHLLCAQWLCHFLLTRSESDEASLLYMPTLYFSCLCTLLLTRGIETPCASSSRICLRCSAITPTCRMQLLDARTCYYR